MTDHIDNWLADWFAGTLSDDRERRLAEHIAECDRCAKEFERVRADFARLASRQGEDRPSESLRQRILDAAEPGARFFDLSDHVRDVLDIDEETTAELFAAIDDESNWVPFPGYDIAFFYFPFADIEPGDAVDAQFVSILRVGRGETFPEHRHLGRERIFMLQGTMVEDDGEVFHRGDYIDHDDDTEHTFRVPDDSPALVGIVLVERGLEIGGVPLGDGGQ